MIADKYKFISRTKLLVLMNIRHFKLFDLIREAGISSSIAYRLLRSTVSRVRYSTAVKIANSLNVQPHKLFASFDEIIRSNLQQESTTLKTPSKKAAQPTISSDRAHKNKPRAANSTKSFGTITCAFCGQLFLKRYSNQKYCCNDCARKAHIRLEVIRERNARIQSYTQTDNGIVIRAFDCQYCGQHVIISDEHDRRTKFCSKYCRCRFNKSVFQKRQHQITPRTFKTCTICGNNFSPNHGNRIYCSHHCSREAKRRYDQNYQQIRKLRAIS